MLGVKMYARSMSDHQHQVRSALVLGTIHLQVVTLGHDLEAWRQGWHGLETGVA